MKKKKIIIGSRGSRLALIYADRAKNEILKVHSTQDIEIKSITTEELSQDANRPLQSGLITDKIVKMLNIIPPSIDDCLNAIIEKNNK